METETPEMTITDQATLIRPTHTDQATKSRPIHMALETPIRTHMGSETLAMTITDQATLIRPTHMDQETTIHPTPTAQAIPIRTRMENATLEMTLTAQAIPIRTRMENATLEMTPMGQAPKTLQTRTGQAILIHTVHQIATLPAVMATTSRTRTVIARQERSWRRLEASSRVTRLRRRVMRSDPTPDIMMNRREVPLFIPAACGNSGLIW